MATALSIRERIMCQLVRDFEKVSAGTNNHLIDWEVVKRTALEDFDELLGPTMCIIEGDETSSDEQASVRKRLEVATEFWFEPFTGEDLASQANMILADVQRTVRTNPLILEDDTSPVCRLALDTVEVRSEIETGFEGLIGGVVVWQVIYRHAQNDPTKFVGF